jgi:hypothetical protein
MSGYTQLHAIVDGIVSRYETIAEADEKRAYRRDLVMLFEELRRHFREMTKHVEADSLAAESIGRLIFHLNKIIVALLGLVEFADVATDLHNALRWLCHSPYWFLGESESFTADAGAIGTLVDAVAKTGILTWQTGDKEIVRECIHSIDAMTSKMLERGADGHGYSEPRTLQTACYLGILALKSEWLDVVGDVKARILAFEERYAEKYLVGVELPNGGQRKSETFVDLLPDRLTHEVQAFADRFDYERYNGVRILGHAEDLMYDLVEVTDIRRFIAEIWGPAGIGGDRQ